MNETGGIETCIHSSESINFVRVTGVTKSFKNCGNEVPPSWPKIRNLQVVPCVPLNLTLTVVKAQGAGRSNRAICKL